MNIATILTNSKIGKPLLFFAFILMVWSDLSAQNYIFEYDVDFKMNIGKNNRRRYYNNMYYKTASSNNEREISDFNMYRVERFHNVRGSLTIPASDGQITEIRVVTDRDVRFVVWKDDFRGKYEVQLYRNYSAYEFDLKGAIPDWGLFTGGGGIPAEINAKTFKMYPQLSISNTDSSDSFPFDEKVIISGISGFPLGVYKWEYSTDAGNTWRAVSSNLIDSSNPGKLMISGADLMSESAFLALMEKRTNIQFRIFNKVQSSNIVVLTPRLSSPHIVNTEVNLEKCNGSSDASVKLTFSRALYPNEKLSILKNAQLTVNNDNIKLDDTNSFTVDNLSAEEYMFSLKGSYFTYPTYSEDENHTTKVLIPARKKLEHSFSKQEVNCYGSNDGKIIVSAKGGTGSFIAELYKNGSNTPFKSIQFTESASGILNQLEAGKYHLKVRDTNECIARDSNGNELVHNIEILQPQDAVSVALEQIVKPTTKSAQDGAITIRIEGGTPKSEGYSIRWSSAGGKTYTSTTIRKDGNAILATLSSIPEDIYTVTVEDANFTNLSSEEQSKPCGCKNALTIELEGPPLLKVSISELSAIKCNGAESGKLRAVGKGGTRISGSGLPYSYTWYKVTGTSEELLSLETDSILSDIPSGKYRVKIADANNVSVLSTVYDLVQPAILKADTKIKHVSCNNGNDGEIEVSVVGGSGNYDVTLVDATSNKSIKNIQLSDSASGKFDRLSSGVFRITIDDGNQCDVFSADGTKFSQIKEVSEPSNPVSISIVNKTAPLSFGSSDGSIAIRIAGGTRDKDTYTIKWTNEAGNVFTPESPEISDEYVLSTLKNIPAGKYFINVYDKNYSALMDEDKKLPCGCIDTLQVVLPEPQKLVVSIKENKAVLCNGSNEGELTARATGGVIINTNNPYRYTWYKISINNDTVEINKSDSTITNLQAGAYKVKVTDANNIEAFSNVFNLTEPDSLVAQLSIRNVDCFDGETGEIKLIITGGDEKYSIEIKDSKTDTPLHTKQAVSNVQVGFDRLKAGVYKIIIQDTAHCQVYTTAGQLFPSTFEIKQPPMPISIAIDTLKHPLSFGASNGEVTVRISGGTRKDKAYDIKWFTEKGELLPSEVPITRGEAVFSTLKNLSDGRYFVRVEDENFSSLEDRDKGFPCGCADTLSIMMKEPPPLNVTIQESLVINCKGEDSGQLTARAKGGVPRSGGLPYSYVWYKLKNNSETAIPHETDSILNRVSAGVYRVKITDANLITAFTDYDITEPDALHIEMNVENVDCSGSATGKVTAIVSGGTPPYKYQWNKEGASGNEITNLYAGVYILRVVDSRGCQLMEKAYVTAPGNFHVEAEITDPVCAESASGAILLTVNGGKAPYKIEWEDKSTGRSRTLLFAGKYSVKITDSSGCFIFQEYILKQPGKLTVTTDKSITLCKNQSRYIIAKSSEENVTFQWFKDGALLKEKADSLAVNSAGEYTVIATNANGCVGNSKTTVMLSEDILEINFTVPTKVAVNSQIHAVNISKPSPEKVRWILPENSEIISESDKEVVFILREKGSFTVALEGVQGDCSKTVHNTIEVVEKRDIDLPKENKALILQFLVAPNPTTGTFKAFVELAESSDISLYLYSSSGQLIDKKEFKNTLKEEVLFDIGNKSSGLFIVILTVRGERSVIKIIKK